MWVLDIYGILNMPQKWESICLFAETTKYEDFEHVKVGCDLDLFS